MITLVACEYCGEKARSFPCRPRRFCSQACRDDARLAEKMATSLPKAVKGARWIPLTQGKFVLVDDDVYDELVEMGSWMFARPGSKPGYAVQRHKDRTPTITFLHRVVMRAKEDEQVDHRDRNTLDCRRQNLRFATSAGNNRNRGKHVSNVRRFASQYKGVCKPADYNKWIALITINDRTIRLGTFVTEEEAARAYDVAAKKHFGAFACLNFPDDDLPKAQHKKRRAS